MFHKMGFFLVLIAAGLAMLLALPAGGLAFAPQQVTRTPTRTLRPTATRTPRPTATRTRRPTATHTPEPTVWAYDFDELNYLSLKPFVPWFFAGQWQSGATGPCASSELVAKAQGVGFPTTLFYESQVERGGLAGLCIYGFPIGETVQVSIEAPGQKPVDRVEVPISDENNGLTMAFLPLRFTLSLPQGEWRTYTSWGDYNLRRKYVHPGSTTPMISHNHPLKAQDLSPADPRRLSPYQSGDRMRVEGIQFEPNLDLPVGLYRKSGNKLVPQAGQVVRTDANGAFRLEFKLDGFAPGSYFIIPVTNREAQDAFGMMLIPFEVVED